MRGGDSMNKYTINNKVYLYNTGSYARERLMSMLASDRIGCNPNFIDGLKATIKKNSKDISVSMRKI